MGEQGIPEVFLDGNIGRSIYFGCDEFNILTLVELTSGLIETSLWGMVWGMKFGIKSDS